MIKLEDAARTFAVGCTERADRDAVRSAMRRVKTRIPRARDDLFRLNDADDLRIARVWLRIDDVDARRTQARDDQIAASNVRMRCIWTQCSAARIPSEVMQFVIGFRHLDLTDTSPVCL